MLVLTDVLNFNSQIVLLFGSQYGIKLLFINYGYLKIMLTSKVFFFLVVNIKYKFLFCICLNNNNT